MSSNLVEEEVMAIGKCKEYIDNVELMDIEKSIENIVNNAHDTLNL